jgi:imidazolonepropionase-like amidohydrolase
MNLVIHAKRLFDGVGNAPIDGATIVVRGDKIIDVGPFDASEIPSDAAVVDLPEHTLTAGLIDSHSHVTIETVGSGAEQLPPSDVELTLGSAARLKQDLVSGVTTMRTLGDRRFIDLAFKKAQLAGMAQAPRLQVAGNLLQPSNVHVSVSEAIADGPTSILKYLRESVRQNVDWIKFYSTPQSRSPDPIYAIYSRSEVELIFQEARRAKKPLAVHCHGGAAADWCIELGVDSLEHGVYLEEPQFRAMAEKKITLVPTTGVVLLQPSEGGSARLLESQDRARNYLRQARKWGVPCIPGTDAVHGNLAFELGIMINCGWTPQEALIAATRGASRLLRLDHEIGTLTKGKLADLVAFRGNPFADPDAFRAVDLVIQGGRIVHNRLDGLAAN